MRDTRQPATRRWMWIAPFLAIALVAEARIAASPGPAAPPALRAAVEYEIDPGHSRVGFKVRHLGISSVHGHFNRFAGRFAFDPADPAAAWAVVTIEAA
ncbi:hypothetical protein BH18GEM1_BH18GEM1_18770 [soil metagenome]